MKSIILLATILILSVCSIESAKNLRTVGAIETKVDPKRVMSPGEFSNISPDASKVITPKYACKLYYIFFKNEIFSFYLIII